MRRAGVIIASQPAMAPRYARNKVADADNVEPDGAGRTTRDHDRLIELRIGQHMALDHELVLYDRQRGQPGEGRNRPLE